MKRPMNLSLRSYVGFYMEGGQAAGRGCIGVEDIGELTPLLAEISWE